MKYVTTKMSKISEMDDYAFVNVIKNIWPEVIKKIRKKLHKEKYKKNWGYLNFSSRGGITPLVYIKTIGCLHTLESGCTMCNYGLRRKSSKIKKTSFLRSLKAALNYLDEVNHEKQTGVYVIGTSGSFFDIQEIPLYARKYIYSIIANKKKDYKKAVFSVESRFEFVSQKDIREIRRVLGDDVTIRIGFGIESTNYLIREACINKNLPLNWQNKIKFFKRYNIKADAHILLKPPFLTEKESIEDAVKSIKEMFKNGLSDRVILMTMNLRPGTVINELANIDKYRLPYIWSVIDVIKKLGPDICQNMMFHGFVVNADGKNIKTVKGCQGCNHLIIPKILKFNKPKKNNWRKLIDLADSIDCQCKKEWREEIKKKGRKNLKERILEGIFLIKRHLDKEKIEKMKLTQTR